MWQWNKMVTRDKDDNYVFPAGMCEITDTADFGYGPSEDYPCGGKATHTVTFETYDPETNTWSKCAQNVCDSHVWDESDELHGYLRLAQVTPYTGEYDGREVTDI